MQFPFTPVNAKIKILILNMQSVCFTESVDFGIVLHTFIFIVILIMQTIETSEIFFYNWYM